MTTVTLWKTVPQPVQLRRIVGRANSCTCHVPDSSRYGQHDLDRRAIVLVDGSSEWQHVDDGTAASTHHCHVETWGNDCDGGHGSEHVDLPHPGEEGGWEFVQWMRMLNFATGASDISGTMEMGQYTDRDGSSHYYATWHGVHDEGTRGTSVKMCADPRCAYQRGSQYDQYAELAGY